MVAAVSDVAATNASPVELIATGAEPRSCCHGCANIAEALIWATAMSAIPGRSPGPEP